MKRKICKFMAALLAVSLTLSASGMNVSAGNMENVSANEISTETSEEVETEDAADSETAEDILTAGAQSIVEMENVTVVYSLYSIPSLDKGIHAPNMRFCRFAALSSIGVRPVRLNRLPCKSTKSHVWGRRVEKR